MEIFGKDPFENIEDTALSESIWSLPKEGESPKIPEYTQQQPVPVVTPQVIQQIPYPPPIIPQYIQPGIQPQIQPQSQPQLQVPQQQIKKEEERKREERRVGKKEDTRKVSYLLNFRLSNEVYGVDVENIREVVRAGKITPVPNAHYHILGIMNLRGRIIPVLSLRRFLGMEDIQMTRSSKILVLDIDELNQIGTLVDDVNEVFPYYPDEIEPITTVKFSGTKYAKGVLRKDDIPIVVIDIKEIISESFTALPS